MNFRENNKGHFQCNNCIAKLKKQEALLVRHKKLLHWLAQHDMQHLMHGTKGKIISMCKEIINYQRLLSRPTY